MCRVMRQGVHNTPWSQKFILLTNTYTLMMYDEDMLRQNLKLFSLESEASIRYKPGHEWLIVHTNELSCCRKIPA